MKIYSLVITVILLTACNGNQPEAGSETTPLVTSKITEIYGNTQGTTYAIICNDSINLEKAEVTDLLAEFDQALSGYIDTSVVSRLNNFTAGTYNYTDQFNYFNRCYELSQDIYTKTNGAFDPTVYPLVDGWGFMKDLETVPDSAAVDSLRALLGFKQGYHFNYTGVANNDVLPALYTVVKNTPGAKLDFNAIAQGLAVDVLAELIEERGGKNYFVEIGGEIRVSGITVEGDAWRIGIDQPIEHSDAENRQNQEIIKLKNKSVATSGSYRRFYEKDGVKYSHTLNPRTGYPVTHSLLSATVVANSCAEADAMATAFMVMGTEKAIEFLDSNKEMGLEAYLIFINEHDQYETYYTKAFGRMIVL